MLQLWILLIALLLALIAKLVYNIWFHPLRKYPGPKLAAASRLWYTLKIFGGHHKYAIKRLHDDYGMVVRIAPNELSYIDPRAWEDIYGELGNKQIELPVRWSSLVTPGKSAHENGQVEKDAAFFATAFNDSESLVDTNSREFRPQKTSATRAFSHGSLLQRSSIMSSYIYHSTDNLRSYLCNRRSSMIDINSWIGNMVFDIHSKLTISRDFGAVDQGPTQHVDVTNMHKAVTVIQYCTQLQYLPKLLTSLPSLLPSRDIFTVLGNVPPLGRAMTDRLSCGKSQDDFASHMMETDEQGGVTNAPTVRKNCLIFILSGVETLPGYTCSVLYNLLAKPEYFTRASEEVRSAFTKREDITLSSTQGLEFLRACMREGLRVSPPFVGTLTRVIPRKGAVVCGQFLPGGTTVGIHNWSITHSESLWKDPEEFRPGRWLGDPYYAEDQREVFKPFGVVPRAYVAQHLVLLEATLIMAKLLFDFDMTVAPGSCGKWPIHVGPCVPTRGSLFIDVKARECV